MERAGYGQMAAVSSDTGSSRAVNCRKVPVRWVRASLGFASPPLSKHSILARLLGGKRPEHLERGKGKEIISFVVLPGLAEADEAEAPGRASGD